MVVWKNLQTSENLIASSELTKSEAVVKGYVLLGKTVHHVH